MPSNSTFPAIIHIRDFVEHVEPDPTRPGKGLSMQLRVSLNLPWKDIQSDDVKQDKILTLVRFFNEGNQSDLYKPNTFVYSSGSFLTTSSDDEEFHISSTPTIWTGQFVPSATVPSLRNLVIRGMKKISNRISCTVPRLPSQ